MVKVAFHPSFKKRFSRIRDKGLKDKLIRQFAKIRDNPEIGKPMRYVRKGTREIYIKPFRLSYLYIEKEKTIVILALYHKDEQ